MKRRILLATLLIGSLSGPLQAQNSLIDQAERRQLDERLTAMTARIEKLEEAILLYQRRINALTDALNASEQDVARLKSGSSGNSATQKSLESLAEAIQEVDRKRMKDNEKVLDALSKLQKDLVDKPSRSIKRATPPSRSTSEKGYEYSVQSGDNSQVIANKLRENGIKVTAQQIIDANPGVAWTKLKIGQKLFIPEP